MVSESMVAGSGMCWMVRAWPGAVPSDALPVWCLVLRCRVPSLAECLAFPVCCLSPISLVSLALRGWRLCR
jgi:hypothetical protein